jgi:hypothetical protein
MYYHNSMYSYVFFTPTRTQKLHRKLLQKTLSTSQNQFNTANSVHCRDTNFYIKTNKMQCVLFSLLLHFTPTCFDVWKRRMQQTKTTHRVCQQMLKKNFGALPEDDVPYVETCRSEVKKQ